MRFSLPILSVLAATAIANPTSLEVHKRDVTADAIQFAAAEAACDIGQCAGVIAAAACLLICRLPPCFPACVSAGASAICPCVSCVPGLGDIVEDAGLCEA